MKDDEMVGWHHQLNGHKSEQTREIVKDREGWCAAVHGDMFQEIEGKNSSLSKFR